MRIQNSTRLPRQWFPSLAPIGTLFVAALLAASLGCEGDGRARLVLYTPHGPELLEVLEPAFEALYPEVDLRWLDMGSQSIHDRIRSEKANPQADVWFGGPDTIFARGAAEGLLAAYRPPWADAVAPDSRHGDDLYFGVYRTAPVLVYNTKAVAEADAPRDWDDLLAERFAEKVLIRDPLASGTMRTLFEMVLARSVAETGSEDEGWHWLEKLDAQTKEYVLGPGLMIEKLVRQEGLVTVWELTDMHWQRQRGRPLEFVFPTSGTPLIHDSIGLVAGASEPEWAERFIDWIGSPEAQRLAAEKAFRLPARTDLDPQQLPPWARRVLSEMTEATFDRQLVAERGSGWMQHWDRAVRARHAP